MQHIKKVKMRIFFYSLTILLCHYWSSCYGQINEFSYKREIHGITDEWHTIILPDDVFGKVSQDLSDVRLYSITQSNDTLEVPYILSLAEDKVTVNEVVFTTLNISHNNQGYYFTFDIPTGETINQIILDFEQKNYDWQVTLEGSQNQEDWYTIIENYRILSLHTAHSNLQFAQLNFHNVQFRYYRICVKSKEKPVLKGARIKKKEVVEGIHRHYNIKKWTVTQNRSAKQTQLDIELANPVPISHLQISIKDTFDYYRPITINYIVDSIHTEQGWHYMYKELTSGTLHSLANNEFRFNTITAQKVKFIIDNKDNQPLTIDTVLMNGYAYVLSARFRDDFTYFLVYGNKDLGSPQYEINRFSPHIPTALMPLSLGEEKTIEKQHIQQNNPLFVHKAWLWAIIGITIVVLGWFTVKIIMAPLHNVTSETTDDEDKV